ncbi:hypothetical protein ACVNPZ_02945 [Staphylococcus aureus]
MKKIKIVPLILIVVVVGFGIYFYASKDKEINNIIDAIEDKNFKQVYKDKQLYLLKAIMVK